MKHKLSFDYLGLSGRGNHQCIYVLVMQKGLEVPGEGGTRVFSPVLSHAGPFVCHRLPSRPRAHKNSGPGSCPSIPHRLLQCSPLCLYRLSLFIDCDFKIGYSFVSSIFWFISFSIIRMKSSLSLTLLFSSLKRSSIFCPEVDVHRQQNLIYLLYSPISFFGTDYSLLHL